MKRLLLLPCLLFSLALSGQSVPDSLALPYGLTVDTVQVIKRDFVVNDYSTIGAEGGLVLSNILFNPPKDTKFFLNGPAFNVLFTHYSKLFGYMPYFGFQIGFAYTNGGYMFKMDKETKITPMQDGYKAATWKVAEMPFLMMFRVDAPHFRIMAKAGIYAGYRWDIQRTVHDNFVDYENVVITGFDVHYYKDKWRDIDRRYDYGLEGGLGVAFVFDPFEFHVNALLKYGWSSLYQPDYASPYYYRFAYPFDLMITAGIHFQLSRRTGKSRAQLRHEAYDAVYNPSVNEEIVPVQ